MIYRQEVSNNTKNDTIKTTMEFQANASSSSSTLNKSWNVFVIKFLYKAFNTDEQKEPMATENTIRQIKSFNKSLQNNNVKW